MGTIKPVLISILCLSLIPGSTFGSSTNSSTNANHSQTTTISVEDTPQQDCQKNEDNPLDELKKLKETIPFYCLFIFAKTALDATALAYSVLQSNEVDFIHDNTGPTKINCRFGSTEVFAGNWTVQSDSCRENANTIWSKSGKSYTLDQSCIGCTTVAIALNLAALPFLFGCQNIKDGIAWAQGCLMLSCLFTSGGFLTALAANGYLWNIGINEYLKGLPQPLQDNLIKNLKEAMKLGAGNLAPTSLIGVPGSVGLVVAILVAVKENLRRRS